MNKKQTTKIFIYNITNNECILTSDMQIASDYINTNRFNLVEWLSNDKVINKTISGYNYMIYKIDYYIGAKVRNPAGGKNIK